MLAFLFESAVRSFAMGIAVWVFLRLSRVRGPQVRSLAWTAVLLSSLTMPLLMKVMESVLTRGPGQAWIPAATSPLFLKPLATLSPPQPASSVDWLTLASILYVLVVVAFVIRLTAGVVRSGLLLRTAVPVHEDWTEGCDVRATDQLTIPVTYRSTVLIPSDWPQWDLFTRESVLLHEKCHVRRYDFYLHLLAGLHRAIFWFSPFAWWLQSQLLELGEVISDDAAIRKMQDRVSYAGILVNFARRGSRSRVVGVAMARGRTVERRVERMLRERSVPPRTSLSRRVFVIAALAPLVGLSAAVWRLTAVALPIPALKATPVAMAPASTQPQATAPGAPASTPGTPPATQYLSDWVEQEVPDIAAPEEQSAYQSLRTDDEREQFIEAFWRRRDPTPNTGENEYRNEYYRRIVLANERYGTRSGVPGWRSDRGRVLIRFGQPDEMETHAMGGTYRRFDSTVGRTVNYPFELWRYRLIEGLGKDIILEFVDTALDGTYRLSSDPNDRFIINEVRELTIF